jgi:hypothetical protein
LEAILHDLEEHDEFDNAVVQCAPSVVAAPSQVKPNTTTMAIAHQEEEKEEEVDELQMWMLTRRG